MTDDVLETLYREGAKQARDLQEQASEGGLRFEVFLPSGLADWILDKVANGVFMDPGEAAFVILKEHYDIEPHANLQDIILQHRIQKGIDSLDSGDSISREDFKKKMEEWVSKPKTKPAIWKKVVIADN